MKKFFIAKLLSNQRLSMAVKGARKIDASDIQEELSRVPAQREQIAYKGRRVCVRAKGTQKKRKRIGEDQKGLWNEQKWSERGRRRRRRRRVEAYIGGDRDRRGFPNNATSEPSDRVPKWIRREGSRYRGKRKKRRKHEGK